MSKPQSPPQPRPVAAPGCRPFELKRNLLVRARKQSGSVPCPSVRLLRQHTHQRLMHTSPIPNTRALSDRRPNQRMRKRSVCRSPSMTRASTAGAATSSPGLPGNDPACLEDLADRVSVVQCRNQQHQPSLIGQIGDTRGERTLEPLSQRQRTRHQAPVLVPANHLGQLDERERVAGRLQQHPTARHKRQPWGDRVEQRSRCLLV